jgi:hypothetical protein
MNRRGGWQHHVARVVKVLLVTALAVPAAASGPGWRDPQRIDDGYDGRFRFVRLRWDSGATFGRRGMNSAWNHDFPRAEINLARILSELTLIDVNPEGRILRLDDPEIFNQPIVYMWEPGFWVMTDEQGARFREYLLKGGFAIFDDFEHEQWNNLEAQMRRILPEARWVELDGSQRIFDVFFRMQKIDFPHPMYGIKPTYYGIFENNDPARRLMAIANHNHDVAEYWEFSDRGLWPIDLSNEAYKLGVNYMIYGLIH